MPLGASRLLTLANPGVAAGPAQRTAVSVTAYGDTRVDSQEAYFGGSAAKFDGTGDYLNASLAVDTEIGTGATTWECWFFVAADAGAGTVAVLSNRNGGASNGEVQMLFRNFDMKIQVNGYGTGAFSANGVGSALSTNTWHHYVWARDDSGSWAIWVNGTRVGNDLVKNKLGLIPLRYMLLDIKYPIVL